MPILGIIASQNYVRIPPSAYESIATVSLTSAAASVDFTSIPSTYQHLQLRIFAHTDRASDNNGYGSFRVNSDSGSNYSWHQLYGDGGSVGAGGAANQTLVPLSAFGGNSNSAFGVSIIDFLDYANTNKFKTTKCLNALDYNGGGEINLISGNWRNTNAITSINIVRGFAVNNWVAGSVFALYGIKG